MNSTSYAVEMLEISKYFGGIVANNKITLRVHSKSIHAVVGENGAGKSTAMNLLYGLYTPDSGKICVDGKAVVFNNSKDAINHGIGMVHQHFMLVPTLSVTENIILGNEIKNGFGLDYSKAKSMIQDISTQYGLLVNPDKLIQDLSVGEQQRVEILKILYRKAKILILDEPTAVLTPPEVEDLFRILRLLREQGKTIIIITHKLSEVVALSDNVTVMRDGKTISELETKNTSAAELARLMVGRDVLLQVSKQPSQPGQEILSIKKLNYINKNKIQVLKNIELMVRGGEILGIAGVEGNGQSELIEALAGLIRPTSGTILFNGQELIGASPKYIRSLGIAHIPEDRHQRGLILDFSLADNLILGSHYREPVTGGIWIRRKSVNELARNVINDFDIRPTNPELSIKSFSGGNQQKLIIAREFGLHPKLLLISQPTRGVDIGAIEFIHKKIISLRDSGVAIILVSAELEEVTSLADRLLVMYAGKIVGEVDPSSTPQSQIGLMMAGER